jgi:two-component system, chemotaxis family, CheB/CheR fusion protein
MERERVERMKKGKNPGVVEKKSIVPSASETAAKRLQTNLTLKKRLMTTKASTKSSPAKPKSKQNTLTKLPGKKLLGAEPLTIVGIGASAGGLEAFTQFLRNLPANTGMAFVLVQHLDPRHESMLTQLLSQRTKMPVNEAQDGIAVEPDHVYIIPPNRDMTISRGILRLVLRTEVRGHHMPIDHFFHSLAEDQKSRAIGVILSGTASDGALGLRAIKAQGGITFAQDEKSAKYGGMPHSAVEAGAVDLILPPEGIAGELVRISRHPYGQTYPRTYLPSKTGIPTDVIRAEDSFRKNGDDLARIFNILQSSAGVDFTYYKHTTLKRRILRRMALLRVEDTKDYVRYLQDDPAEVEALYHDVLINVTGFFRDPETFEALREKVFPVITKNRQPQAPIRVWAPGCSTGEEAYSIAISLVEFLGKNATNSLIRIFATDLSEKAINNARTGRYPESIARNLSPERLERFFVKVDGSYQVSKSIRERCVFAKHDITRDPPFSNLDLISCRNVLIYMGPVLQKRAMAVFHYALNPTGFLLLGKSEAIGRYLHLFAAADKKYKIYSKKPAPHPIALGLAPMDYGSKRVAIGRDTGEAGFDIKKEAERIILSKYAPAGVVVNERLEILDFHGHTGIYLEHSQGEASLNLLKMAREGLKLPLRTVIHEAKRQGTPVRTEGLRVKSDGQLREMNLEVFPVKAPHPGEGYFLILFEDTTVHPSGEPGTKTPARTKVRRSRTGKSEEDGEIIRLEQELQAAQKHLQSVIEEYEATNEELRAANEEVLSGNEELQSINEELETAKEELQSTNEELTTLNDELQSRNLTLDQLNFDMINLFTSVNLPVIMLGSDLFIRRFTPMAEKVLNLTATDIGRSILRIQLGIHVPDLEKSILEVINTGIVKEGEVQDQEGVWYSMQIRPYRTTENRIEGAVLTWVNINALKRSLEQARESRDFAEAIVETIREPLIVLDKDFLVKSANRSFYQTFRTSPGETENRLIYELGNHQWDVPEIRKTLEDVLPKKVSLQDLEIERDFPAIGHRIMQLNARRIAQRDTGTQMILLAIEDVTERKRMEKMRMQEAELSLASQVLTAQENERGRVAREIHDGIGQALVSTKFKVDSVLQQLIKDGIEAGPPLLEIILPILQESIEEARRVQLGLRPSILDELGILPTITWFCREFQKTYSAIRIESQIGIEEKEVHPILKTTIYRVMQEALNNVAKHGKANLVSLTLRRTGDKIQLIIQDNGQGFDVKRALSVESTQRGFGLTSMRERVEILKGTFAIESAQGKGTTITAIWEAENRSGMNATSTDRRSP